MENSDGDAADDRDVGLNADNVAVSIALERTRKGRTQGQDAADSLLAAQEALIADQRDLLREQLGHMRLKHVSERLKVTLQLVTMTLGLLLVAGLGWMAWDAAHDESVVVRAFTVPPAYAARGLSGEVVAERFLARLRAVTNLTASHSIVVFNSARKEAAEARLDIPETGISLGEVHRLLVERLGHRMVITGSLVDQGADEIALELNISGGLQRHADGTALRATDSTLAAHGPPERLDEVLQQLAEQTFVTANPSQLTLYFESVGRMDDALGAAKAYALQMQAGSPNMGSALTLWGSHEPDRVRSIRLLRRSVGLNPQSMIAWRNLAASLAAQGDEAGSLAATKRGEELQGKYEERQFGWAARPRILRTLLRREAPAHRGLRGYSGTC